MRSGPVTFVLRFDQCNGTSTVFNQRAGRGEDPGLDGPACIDRHQVDRFVQQQVQGITTLAHHHVWVVAEFGMQDIGGRVDREDACGAVLKQAVCKPPDVAAQVGAHQTMDVHASIREMLESPGELEPAPRDE